MPVYPSGHFSGLATAYREADKMYEEQKAAAIRWQGSRDYETLVQSGVDPRDALRRTAQKIFFNDPRAFAATVPSLLSEPGGLQTDPVTGRRFTVDRFGNWKAVPQGPVGYRTLYDDQGQRFVVPFEQGAAGVNVPSQMGTPPAPRVWQAGPGMSPYAIRPGGGMTRLMRDPNAIAAGKLALQKAQEEGAEALRRYRAAEVAQAGGRSKVGWNVPWNPTVESEMAAAKKELEQLQLDTTGQPLQGTDLFTQVYGESYNQPPGGQVGQGQAAAPAQGAPGAPAQRPPVRLENVQLPGGGFMLRRAPASPGAAQGPTAAQSPRRTVTRQKRMPDGRIVKAIFDAETHQFIDMIE